MGDARSGEGAGIEVDMEMDGEEGSKSGEEGEEDG